MLCKIKVDKYKPILEDMQLTPVLSKIIDKYFIPDSIYFNSGSIVINNKSDVSYIVKKDKIFKINKQERLKFKIGELYIWKSIDSFNQNNIYIADSIYKYINYILKLDDSYQWFGIGGEFMLYFLNHKISETVINKKRNYIGITNSSSIYDDAVFNANLHSFDININLIDYNNISQYPILSESDTCIIMQVSKITNIMIEYILANSGVVKKIIIINCHQKDYETKTMKLKDKYKQKTSKYWMNGRTPIGVYCWFNN